MLIFFLVWSGTTLGWLGREEAVLQMEPSGLFLEPGILSKEENKVRECLTKAAEALPKLSVRRNQNTEVKVTIPFQKKKGRQGVPCWPSG